MKDNFLIFILTISIFTFTGCTDSKKEIKYNKAHKEPAMPLFLNLSPQMSQQTFDSTLTELTRQGKLIDGKFAITLDGQELEFNVSKTENSIRLTCQEIRSTSNTLNKMEKYRKYEKYNKYFDILAENINKLFESKYSAVKIPELLNELGGQQKMFKDDKKIITLYFRKISCPNPLKDNLGFHDELNADEVGESKMGEMYAKMDAEKPLEFGLSICIDYYNQEEGEIYKQKLLERHKKNLRQIENLERIKSLKKSNLKDL